MKLTHEERALLDGKEGLARQKAMDLLVRYGEALGADKLVDTNNVCGALVSAQPYKREFASRMENIDAVFCEFHLDSQETVEIPPVRAFTCRVTETMDPDHWRMQGISQEIHDIVMRNNHFCRRIGIQLMNTCAPYLVGNVPVMGEHCAWMESSAIVYANSALGARTNTEGAESTGAAMMVGKIPYWGYHLDENRLGTHLVSVGIDVESVMDWGLLAYYVGEMVQERVPVIQGIQRRPNISRLKHFAAAAASSGGIEMSHIVGITPEAHTLNQAFGGNKPLEELSFGEEERRIAYENLTSGTDPNVDFVALGCPHYTVEQVWQVCQLLGDKKVHSNTSLWIFMPWALKQIADRQGYTDALTNAGAVLMTDTCPVFGHVYPKGTKVACTDSAKQAHYLPAWLGLETWFGSVEDCVEAAITGQWKGELK
jgi:predicted aconitase